MRLYPAAIVALCLLALTPLRSTLLANMASPVARGDVAAEPMPALDSVQILHENLAIDLRPFAANGSALVEVTYRIRNVGSPRHIDLVFIAAALEPGADTAFEVLFDGVPIHGVRRDSTPLPPEWSLPPTTPPLGKGAGVPYEAGRAGGDVPAGAGAHVAALGFTLDVGADEHTIFVRYQARGTARSIAPPTRLWQLAYILAPARRWAGFGGLDVVVCLPAAWEAAAWPAMQRTGDSLVGSWKNVPADALALTLRMQPPSELLMATARYLPLLLGAMLGLLLAAGIARRWGRRFAQRGRSSFIVQASVAFALGGVAALLVFIGGSLSVTWVRALLGEQMVRGLEYGRAVELLMFHVPGAFVVGTILAFIAFSRAQRRALTQPATGT